MTYSHILEFYIVDFDHFVLIRYTPIIRGNKEQLLEWLKTLIFSSEKKISIAALV